RRLHRHELERRQLGSAGEGIAEEARGERVAVLVVDELLVERLADAAADATVALALGDHGADDPAGVVDGDDPLELDLPRLRVDAGNGDVRAERERAGEIGRANV